MCLLIKRKFKSEKTALAFFDKPSVATKNITVYKVLVVQKYTFDIRSPYKYTLYHPGKLSSVFGFSYSKNSLKRDKQLSIECGIHSFVKRKDAQKTADMFEKCFVTKCVIPKGTKYFLGVYGDDEIIPNYVSLALQMPKVIDASKANF